MVPFCHPGANVKRRPLDMVAGCVVAVVGKVCSNVAEQRRKRLKRIGQIWALRCSLLQCILSQHAQ